MIRLTTCCSFFFFLFNIKIQDPGSKTNPSCNLSSNIRSFFTLFSVAVKIRRTKHMDYGRNETLDRFFYIISVAFIMNKIICKGNLLVLEWQRKTSTALLLSFHLSILLKYYTFESPTLSAKIQHTTLLAYMRGGKTGRCPRAQSHCKHFYEHYCKFLKIIIIFDFFIFVLVLDCSLL